MWILRRWSFRSILLTRWTDVELFLRPLFYRLPTTFESLQILQYLLVQSLNGSRAIFLVVGTFYSSWGRRRSVINVHGNTLSLIGIDADDHEKWVTVRNIARLRCDSQLTTASFCPDVKHDKAIENTGIQGDSYIHSYFSIEI